LVAKSAGDFADSSVCPEQPQFPTDPRRAPKGLSEILRRLSKEEFLQILIAKTIQHKFPDSPPWWMVVSARSTLPTAVNALSYSFTAFPFTLCLMRIPSLRISNRHSLPH
jgi:hypothetical protein